MEDVDDQPLVSGTIDELYRTEFARLVRSLAVVDGPEAAADAVQEAFIAADRRWRKVSRMDDPVGWIRRAAVNRLLNGRRNTRRRAELLAGVRPVAVDDLDPLDLDLLAAIRALPTQQRLVICLHHLGGYRITEVAADLGIAPGTVKSHLHDARRALRAHLEVTDDA
jgi:RNA polymerase sigma-70 factor (ECF subfamily)